MMNHTDAAKVLADAGITALIEKLIRDEEEATIRGTFLGTADAMTKKAARRADESRKALDIAIAEAITR